MPTPPSRGGSTPDGRPAFAEVPARRAIEVLLCGVPNASNCGDGAIMDCLEKLLLDSSPSVRIRRFDFVDRGAAGQRGSDQPRSPKRDLLSKLPERAFRLLTVMSTLLTKIPGIVRRAAEIRRCDAVVFAGGQILHDNHGVFPMCMAMTLALSRRDASVAFFSCGASARWGGLSRTLLRHALRRRRLIFAGFRDRLSLENATRVLGPFDVAAGVVPDPAIVTAEVYGLRKSAGASGRLGVGIAHAGVVEGADAASGRAPRARDFWGRLIPALLEVAPGGVTLFCNGEEEDQAELERVAQMLRLRGLPQPVEVAAPPRSSRELAATLSGFDAVVAHRLHAHVIAYSLKVPTVGFACHEKVESFFQSVGRERCLFSVTAPNLEELVDGVRMMRAPGAGGFDRAVELEARLRESARSLLERIEAALPGDREAPAPCHRVAGTKAPAGGNVR